MHMSERFFQDKGIQAYTGTELLLKGALEGKVSLLTGYPGSPVADFFNAGKTIRDYLREKGIVFQVANNEALSAARLNGAQMEDIKAIAVMKSVGAHVASDGLALGNIAKTSHKGGALVVIGDDPWSESTQVPTDSRYLSKHLHMPVLMPGTFQELKDWVSIGLDLSAKSNLFISYIVTTNLADGGGTVSVYGNQAPTINARRPVEIDTASIPVEETVVLSPRTAAREETLADRYGDLLHFSEMYELNKIFHREGTNKIGFITSGIAHSYLEHALYELGLQEKTKILKLGLVFPLDPEIIQEFCDSVEQVVVIEEKRNFVESQVTTIVKDLYQAGKMKRSTPVWGKQFPFDLPGVPSTRGLNPSMVIELIAPLLMKILPESAGIDRKRVDAELALITETTKFQFQIPQRTPTFCPGCPHRDSASVLLEIKRDFKSAGYMRKYHKREPMDLLFHGDTGCYTMLMFDPNKDLMHNYSGMGLGGGTGAGINPFITNKQAVFMGDSTFFHSGMIAISDAIKHNQDITFIILDNGATAMTGHQPTPGQEYDIVGNKTVIQKIDDVICGMTSGTEIRVSRTNPSYRTEYRDLLEETLLQDGVKIIIADKECGITYDRKVATEEKKVIRQKGFLPEKKVINVTPETCEYCLECTKATGCPGLTIEATPQGPKMVTDLSLCKADEACTRIHACPSFERVIIKRKQAVPKIPFGLEELSTIPSPKSDLFQDTWRAYVAGVGGMGIGVVTAILVQAGVKQGYQVQFVDKKGLAIRNGGVYSHIVFSKTGIELSPITPYGKANLLIGLDFLEAARSIHPKMNLRVANPRLTSALINTHITPTMGMLLGKDQFDHKGLEEAIRRMTRRDKYFSLNISDISQRFLGNTVFSNIVMLGFAFQKGLLPIELETLEWAIAKSVPGRALEENMDAFHLGRLCAENPGRFIHQEPDTYESMMNEKEELLSRAGRRGKKVSRIYKNLVTRTVAALRLDDGVNMHLAVNIYDLIRYDNINYARVYVDIVKKIRDLDRAEYQFEATKAAIQYLYKVMMIKDEVYVAHLLTSEEKRKRDYERYRIDPERGDRLTYLHFTRPEFVIFGKQIRFQMVTRNWQLNIMKRMKFLRNILLGWHRKEKEFRNWYIELARKFCYSDQKSYYTYVNALRAPEEVSGYREVRYPKMELAKQKAETMLGICYIPAKEISRSIRI
ncbi:MAG: hypothetical protein A3J12_04935 [Omnitrophica bacterium RIFCSPLOWO2_02_FULL_44_11]|nr:MAG: hypothetical protein A3J12_04935 [Omnitrophica bacterium RIFCSPLOWO2_02_FULL_44_11]